MPQWQLDDSLSISQSHSIWRLKAPNVRSLTLPRTRSSLFCSARWAFLALVTAALSELAHWLFSDLCLRWVGTLHTTHYKRPRLLATCSSRSGFWNWLLVGAHASCRLVAWDQLSAFLRTQPRLERVLSFLHIRVYMVLRSRVWSASFSKVISACSIFIFLKCSNMQKQ